MPVIICVAPGRTPLTIFKLQSILPLVLPIVISSSDTTFLPYKMVDEAADLPSWVIPQLSSPLFLSDLRDIYDELVQKVKQEEPKDPNPYLNVTLVCCLLLQIHQHETEDSDPPILTEGQHMILESTIFRSKLLLECLGVVDDGVVDMESYLQVDRATDTKDSVNSSYSWKWTQSRELISFDRKALAEEEDILIRMAESPIPPSSQETAGTAGTSDGDRDLQRRIRKEWALPS